MLLHASREVLNRFPETKIVFGGDGEIKKNKALAEELGIVDRCEFHGWVTGSEREALFKRAAVCCLPSKNEGLPMSVLEAMAHGIPTVATAVGGVPQVIEDGISGFLIDVDDTESLAQKISSLLGDSMLRKSVGMASRDVVARSFGVDRSIEQLLVLYCALDDRCRTA